MDRRYYGLKALILALGIGVAVYSSFFDTRPVLSNYAHAHYGAASSVRDVVTTTTIRVSKAVGKFLSRSDCWARGGV